MRAGHAEDEGATVKNYAIICENGVCVFIKQFGVCVLYIKSHNESGNRKQTWCFWDGWIKPTL